MSLSIYQDLVDDLVRDDTGKITSSDRDDAIARAIDRYSKDKPNLTVEDITAPGGHYINLPTGWQIGFSELRAIEYPIGEFPPSLLHQDSFDLYRGPSGQQIIIADAITSGQQLRVTFTTRHVVDMTQDTTPQTDREPISAWAAAFLLDQLASLYSGDSDSTIQADSVDHNSKAAEYALRAKTLRKRYYDELGIDPKRNVAAGVVVDFDQKDSQGRERLMHPDRYR